MLQRSLGVGMILESGESGLETSLEEMKGIWLKVVREHVFSREQRPKTQKCFGAWLVEQSDRKGELWEVKFKKPVRL